MSDPDDAPDLLAALDQLAASLRARAQLLASYMGDLTSFGFTRDEALAIVLDYQTVLDEQTE